MAIEFNATERHVLHHQGGFSRQLIYFWERRGYVPSKHLLGVSRLIGRSLEELLGGVEDTKIKMAGVGKKTKTRG